MPANTTAKIDVKVGQDLQSLTGYRKKVT